MLEEPGAAGGRECFTGIRVGNTNGRGGPAASLGRKERRLWLRVQAKGKGQRRGRARARLSNGGVWGAREALAGGGGGSGGGGGFLYDRPGQVSAGPQCRVSGGQTTLLGAPASDLWAPAMEFCEPRVFHSATSDVEKAEFKSGSQWQGKGLGAAE